ncbi:MAG: 3-phosphoshikimate 1-carboxyvinyltransferase, partial [Waddliaceae bacterium]|nr:3-phosphoshikimate 1-carboxyvinyltransferase [Waddliaceae bacterium]
PLVDKNSTITVKNPTSIPYIAMTIALLKKYGIKITHDDTYENFKIKGKQKYKPCTYNIEGDWSAAAPMLVAGAIRGKTFVSGVDILSEQADKEILSVLKDAGAYVDLRDDGIAVEKRDLKAFEFDVTNHPDLLPPLVALACYCQGQTEITGIERLRYKESDRVQALATELSRLGAYISCEDNSMIITGKALTGGFADANNDHRIAMALAIAALRAQGDVFIEGWKSVAKSYPNFFQHLEAISE